MYYSSRPMRVSAKTLIIGLLSANPLETPSVPVRHLVRAASVFGIAENSVRVAIVRLRAEGVVDSPDRGHYKLGPASHAINEQVMSWRRASEMMRPWDGSWAGVFTFHLSRTDRPALRRRTRALRLFGFRDLRSGLAIRPDNLAGGVPELRKRLMELGLEPGGLVFNLREFEASEEKRLEELWDVARMRALYADLADQLETSRVATLSMPIEEALRESFLLGREALRQVVLDPLLPEPLVPAAERDTLLEAMRRYDAAGRELWRPFLLNEA